MVRKDKSERRGVEGKSASGSDANTKKDTVKKGFPTTTSTQGSIKSRSKSAETKVSDEEQVRTTSMATTNVPPNLTANYGASSRMRNDKANKLRVSKSSKKAPDFGMSKPLGQFPAKLITSTSVISGKVSGSGSNTYTKSAKPIHHKAHCNINNTQVSQNQKSTQTQQDFSQNFPTPRSITNTPHNRSNKQESNSSSPTSLSQASAVTDTSTEKTNAVMQEGTANKTKHKQKPVAYYLSLENNATPIRVGKRILKETLSEEFLNKENRNILSNYISALNASAIKIDTNKKKLPKDVTQNLPKTKIIVDPTKTLKEALYDNKPEFIRRSEYRVNILRQIKEERCAFSERQRRWLEEFASSAPKNQPKTDVLPPNITPPKPRRLFDYKQMVAETRCKYQQLPEVLTSKYDAKRRSSYCTNRIMANIYKRKLKDNVLKGKVSLVHHINIVN